MMTLTAIFSWSLVALAIGYDVLTRYIQEPTESDVIKNAGWDWSIIPLCLGIVLGHWTGTRYSVAHSAWGYAIPVLAGYLAWGFVKWRQRKRLGFRPVYHVWEWPLLHALIGIVLGVIAWGQTYDRKDPGRK
jgi:hypothetical protein